MGHIDLAAPTALRHSRTIVPSNRKMQSALCADDPRHEQSDASGKPRTDGGEDRGVLVNDYSPVFTLWRVEGICTAFKPRVVWIFQAEGGAVTKEAADAYFELLEFTVAGCLDDFVTFYDFTGGITNFLPFAMQLASNAGRIRAVMKPVRTIILCPNATVRNVMRIIISLVGGESPYVIVDTLDQGWETAFAARKVAESPLRDSYEGTSLTSGMDPALTAQHVASMTMDGGSQNHPY